MKNLTILTLKKCRWCQGSNISVKPYLVEDFPVADEYHDIEVEALVCEDCGFALYELNGKVIKEFSVTNYKIETKYLKSDQEVKRESVVE